MILIYVDNKRIGEVAGIAENLGKVGYRNPRYFDKPEKCDGVYVHGNYPKIIEAYGDKILKDTTPASPVLHEVVYPKVIEQEIVSPHSYDYTVREVVKMAKDMSHEQIKVFTRGDERKTVQKLL